MNSASTDESRIKVTVGELDLVMEREFAAPRELVWKALTEAEHVSRWWAPFDYTIPSCTIDLRPGGLWHYSMRSETGEEHWIRSVYREVVKPERIVFTSVFSDEHANPNDEIPEQFNTIKLEELASGNTRLTFRVRFDRAEDLKFTVDAGMAVGFENATEKLAQVLAKLRN